MITENLSTLKIHKLSQAQYERELAAGNIDPNALYLTQDEGSESYGVVQYNEMQELTREQRTQARFNIGASDINDIYHNGLREYYYTWDGITEGKDVIVIKNMLEYADGSFSDAYFYKISDKVPAREIMRNYNDALITYDSGSTIHIYQGGANSDSISIVNSYSANYEEFDGYYYINAPWRYILFIEEAGSYNFNLLDRELTFEAPSAGVYFPFTASNTSTIHYITNLQLTSSMKTGIYLNSGAGYNKKRFIVGIDDSGALQTVDENDTTVKMATESSVANQISTAIDNLTKVTALTQEEYNKLVADGTVQADVAYMIVSGSA